MAKPNDERKEQVRKSLAGMKYLYVDKDGRKSWRPMHPSK